MNEVEVGGGLVAGSSDYKAYLTQLGQELVLSLAIT